jgi:hypothetical protein
MRVKKQSSSRREGLGKETFAEKPARTPPHSGPSTPITSNHLNAAGSSGRRAVRQRALLHMWHRLEPELQSLDFDAQEFACQACSVYRRGQLPETKNAYKQRRRWLGRVARDLENLRRDLERLGPAVEVLCDDLRIAHRPAREPVPLLQLMGLRGSDEYFRLRSLPDPAKSLVEFLQILGAAERFLSQETQLIRDAIPKTRALWRSKPEIGWRRGGLQYILMRLLRERAAPRITVRQAHERIAKVLHKLDGGAISSDEVKGYFPAIRQAIERLSPTYKEKCDQVLATRLKLPPKN